MKLSDKVEDSQVMFGVFVFVPYPEAAPVTYVVEHTQFKCDRDVVVLNSGGTSAVFKITDLEDPMDSTGESHCIYCAVAGRHWSYVGQISGNQLEKYLLANR
jgi:hypothetical protein